MNRFCTSCGQPLPEGSLFCIECGVSQAAPQASPPSVPSPAPPQPPSQLKPVVSPIEPPPARPVQASRTQGRFSWARAVSAMLASLAVIGGIYLGRVGLRTTSTPSTPTTSPSLQAPTPEAQAAGPDLSLAEGEWTVDPRDPKFSESDRGTFYLHREGKELRGPGPEDSSFRLWVEGSVLVGEARESSGKQWKMGWEWVEPGRRVHLRMDDGRGVSQEAQLIRPSDLPPVSPSATPSPTALPVLFEVSGDVNGDGRSETIRVLGLDGQDQPDTQGHKQMLILGADSKPLFRSEPFQEPFHLDSDVYAQKPEERAGVHILVKGSGFPLIRLVFASASGNFCDFKFNGRQFVLAEIGD